MEALGTDWDTIVFLAISVAVFLVLPVCIYIAVKRLFSKRLGRIFVNVLGAGGLSLGLILMGYPFVNSPTHPGGLAILILIPLGGLLSITCAILLWFNNRRQ